MKPESLTPQERLSTLLNLGQNSRVGRELLSVSNQHVGYEKWDVPEYLVYVLPSFYKYFGGGGEEEFYRQLDIPHLILLNNLFTLTLSI
jgi:hypothetical protein